jgi:hypothetical protein
MTLRISGPMGGGMNHLRLLLGLRPGGEIRDLSGRRLTQEQKQEFCIRTWYSDRRSHTGSAPSDQAWWVSNGGYRWQAQSYWLRMEWMTRDLYQESEIHHTVEPDQGVRFVTRPDSDQLVCRIYKAKCPNLNGNTWSEQIRHSEDFRAEPKVAVPVFLPDFYESEWCDHNLKHLTDRLEMQGVDPDLARSVHHRWCELNQELLKKRNL